jgi:hypothetical protein
MYFWTLSRLSSRCLNRAPSRDVIGGEKCQGGSAVLLTPLSLSSLPRMEKRKVDDASHQPVPKRTRSSALTFRVARAPPTRRRSSRVTTIKKTAGGRRGHLTEDRLHSPDASATLTNVVVSDPPLPDLGQLDDAGVLAGVPSQPSKSKRIRKNTTSVSITSLLINVD